MISESKIVQKLKLLTCNNFLQVRGVFETPVNIYVGAFLKKQLTVKSSQLFLQKSSIVDVQLGSKQASAYYYNEF